MKKKFFPLFIVAITFLGISSVHADDNSNVFNVSYFYNYYETLTSITNEEVSSLVDYYNNNFSSTYDNYIIFTDGVTDYSYRLRLMPTNCDYFTVYWDSNSHNYLALSSSCLPSSSIYLDNNDTVQVMTGPQDLFTQIMFYKTSTDFTFNGYYNTDYEIDKLVIPSYENTSLDVSYPSYELYLNDVIPTYETLSSGSFDSYTTINVNDYSYIVLSLKNYNQNSFWTNIYTQGRLCLTPVYNYGMTQKQDIITGSKNQGCTTKYDSLTPVNVNIIQADIDNHAVYYIKSYNNESTTIKVDNRVFDISYISSSDENNPSVIIGGRSYPVIPYSDLTDSANISTEDGYISGQVCNPGDVNCASTITGLDITDLFTQPLQLFKTMGSAITSVLGVITAFIMFLPPTLQAFLYTAFFLVVILGIVKVLL